jgi:hypothetical protein
MLFAPVGLALAPAPTLLAQDSNQITIKDPAEFNSYQNAITQTDPKAKASASELFLTQFPQSVVKKAVLDGLVDAYASFDGAKAVDAATRLLQVDPNNLKAMYIIVAIKKQQAAQAASANPPNTALQSQLLDDAAAMATKGLAATKPADVKDDDFKKQKATTDPFFHSAIAYDDAFSKKDYKAAITEFRTELEMTPPDATKSGAALNDTYQLADAYTKEDPKDMVSAVWFFSRAADFAPANFKAGIEGNAKYWYKRYHGNADGFDAVEAKAGTSLFPTPDYTITPAPTKADLAHQAVVSTPDLASMAMGDKEFVLANGSKEDADKVWAVVDKENSTLIPGLVIAATASQIQLAVTDDAKQDKVADFTINMKEPLADKDIPAVGSTVTNLVGTFDSYTQNPAQIVLKDGALQAEKKAKPVVKKKPTAAHKASSK